MVRVVDEAHHVVSAAMEDFFADRGLDDLLVVHLSCHGVKDDNGRLYFAARNTKRRRLASTAVPAAYLNDLMERCRARSIVLLLDCCYSGAFMPGSKGDEGVHLKESLSGHGRAVLTASNAIEYAWEGDTLSGEAQASIFTAAIVEGLETGEADRDHDGAVSIDDLHKHVYERVREARRGQTPLLWSLGLAGTLHIARNPRPQPAAPAAPPAPPAHAPPPERRSRRRPVVAALASVLVVAVMVAAVVASGSDDKRPLNRPGGVAVGPDGAVYVSDTMGQRIRRITDDGTMTLVAGGGDNFQGAGVPATEVTLNFPRGIAVAADGTLYFADRYHAVVRKVTPDGRITTVAGDGQAEYRGDGGPALQASVNEPLGVALAADGTLFIADLGNHVVRRVDPAGLISTFAGNGQDGSAGDGGPARSASLRGPADVAVARDGTVYIADWSDHKVRAVTPGGTISTVAGTGTAGYTGEGGPASTAALSAPQGVAVADDGTLLIADTQNNRIRRVGTAQVITPVAGDGVPRFAGDGGPSVSASLRAPEDVTVAPGGEIYIADTGNHRVRKIEQNGTIRTLA